MRITNNMMTNSMLNRINKNMSNLDTYYTQLSSGKKIQKPSENPIVGSRALKFRNIVSSTEQYTSNSKQAYSWMETTESAFTNITSLLTSMSELCVQGGNDSYKDEDRLKILNQFNSLTEQLETELNSTYMGRYVFSGYKTDQATIIKDEVTGKNILNPEVYKVSVNPDKLLEEVTNGVIKDTNDATSRIAELNDLIAAGGDTSALEAERDKLIDKLKDTVSANGMELKVSDDKQTIKFVTKTDSSGSGSGSTGGTTSGGTSGSTGTGTLYKEITLVDGTKSYPVSADINDAKDGVDFSVNGDGVDLVIPDSQLDAAKTSNLIKLEVGTNNYIEINSLATDIYTPEMYDTLHYFDKVADYMAGKLSTDDVKEYFGGVTYESLSEAEKTNFDSNLRDKFDAMITKVNDINTSITEQHTNLGVRMSRISLIQDRLGDDKVNYTKLLSDNEDINYAEVAMNFNTANASYQASLKTGMTITQLTLADYL